MYFEMAGLQCGEKAKLLFIKAQTANMAIPEENNGLAVSSMQRLAQPILAPQSTHAGKNQGAPVGFVLSAMAYTLPLYSHPSNYVQHLLGPQLLEH